MGVDSRHADQQVRGAIVLPHGTGKNVRVLAICKGDNIEKAKEAGAEFVGAEEMTQRSKTRGWMDFDVVITTPDMMGLVGRLGKVLGPRGLMPNPKAGTVTPDIAKAVKEAKAGKIEYRLDKTNIIHCPIGKASFGVRKVTGKLLILCWVLLLKQNLLLQKASTLNPVWLPPRWVLASVSTRQAGRLICLTID